MRVECYVEDVDLDGDYATVPGVAATCSRCDHETESFGTSAVSVRRCMVLMREECPMNERNYYFATHGEDED